MKRKPKRRPDGRWQRKSRGKLFISSVSQEDADRMAKEYAAMIDAGMNRRSETMTVREYALAWLPRNKSDVSEDTYNGCAHRIKVLCDHMGDMLIKDVTPSDIKAVYTNYLSGKSKSLINKTSCLFAEIFENAVEDGFCRTNPCKAKSAKPPEGSEGSHRALEPWERDLIENHLKDNSIYPLVMLMLYTGLRPSEAMVINIEKDVDFEKGFITVHRARHSNGNKVTVTNKGKTKKAVGRSIPLFSPLRAVLDGKTGLVASYNGGQVFKKGTWVGRWNTYIRQMEEYINGHTKRSHHTKKSDPLYPKIHQLIKQGKVDEAMELRYADWKTFDVKPYDLRHEFCSWCCDNEVDMHTLIEWMGHKDSKMIQRIYDHVRESRVQKQVEKLEFVIKSSQNGSQE